jgi:hypothetical protein
MPATLVDEPVVPPTDEDQIVQVGASAVGPMLDVMHLEERGSAVTGKLAVVVPGLDLSTQPAGDLPRLATDPDWFALLFDGGLDIAVTCEQSVRLIGHHRSTTHLGYASTVFRVGQRIELGMDVEDGDRPISFGVCGTHLDECRSHLGSPILEGPWVGVVCLAVSTRRSSTIRAPTPDSLPLMSI